jgi:hypothetical protein
VRGNVLHKLYYCFPQSQRRFAECQSGHRNGLGHAQMPNGTRQSFAHVYVSGDMTYIGLKSAVRTTLAAIYKDKTT